MKTREHTQSHGKMSVVIGQEAWQTRGRMGRDHYCFYYYTSVVQHPATCLGRHGVISLPHPTLPQNSNIYEQVHVNQQTTGKTMSNRELNML